MPAPRAAAMPLAFEVSTSPVSTPERDTGFISAISRDNFYSKSTFRPYSLTFVIEYPGNIARA